MSKIQLNHYSSEFRASAVKLAMESDQSTAQTARDLGINANTLYTWVSNSNSKSTQTDMTKNNTENNLEEIKRLRKQLAIVKQERDLLKNAAAYFAKESQ